MEATAWHGGPYQEIARSGMDNERDDEAAVRELDRAWNDAYVPNDRTPLAEILADDFAAVHHGGRSRKLSAWMRAAAQVRLSGY